MAHMVNVFQVAGMFGPLKPSVQEQLYISTPYSYIIEQHISRPEMTKVDICISEYSSIRGAPPIKEFSMQDPG